CLVAPDQDGRRRFPPERRRGGSTDPARRAGHDDRLVTKQHAGEFYTPCLAEGTLSWLEHSPARPRRVRIRRFPAETTETCRQAFCLLGRSDPAPCPSCLPKTPIQRARLRWLPACPKRK